MNDGENVTGVLFVKYGFSYQSVPLLDTLYTDILKIVRGLHGTYRSFRKSLSRSFAFEQQNVFKTGNRRGRERSAVL